MAIRRLTKSDRPMTLGAFKPVGHVVVALPDDETALAAIRSLNAAGFDPDDVLHYTADEEGAQMEQMLQHASEFAGFGYEVTLMRRYRTLAREGCAWLLVYAPDAQSTARVAEVARRHGARLAEKYHWLAVEDLV
jgi:hypothetical protein